MTEKKKGWKKKLENGRGGGPGERKKKKKKRKSGENWEDEVRQRKKEEKERERRKSHKWRERNGIKKYFFYCISIRTIPKMKRYCSRVSKFIWYRTPHENGFLVFGVPNVKYLAFWHTWWECSMTFGTFNENALMLKFSSRCNPPHFVHRLTKRLIKAPKMRYMA